MPNLDTSTRAVSGSQYEVIEDINFSVEIQSTPELSEPELGCSSIDWEELRKRSLLPGGFGDDRVSIWPKLLHVEPIPPQTHDVTPSSYENEPALSSNKSRGSEEHQEDEGVELKDDYDETHPDERQIKLDTDRSFVLYPVGSNHDRDKDTLQGDLNSLLVSLFRKRRKLCYFQGYHDIITVLFLTLPQELQLPCAEKLSLHRIRDSMGSGLEPILGLLRVTRNLLRLADPEYAKLLEQSSPLPFYALSNLLTLFAHDMPTLPLIQHVFDYLLCRPPISAVYLSAAIILSRKGEVARLEEEGEGGMIHSLLSGLPDLVDSVTIEDAEYGKRDVSLEIQDINTDSRILMDGQDRHDTEFEDTDDSSLQTETSNSSNNIPELLTSSSHVINESSAPLAATVAGATDGHDDTVDLHWRGSITASGSTTANAAGFPSGSISEPKEVGKTDEGEEQEAIIEQLASPIRIPSRTLQEPILQHLQDGSSGLDEPDTSNAELDTGAASHTNSPPPLYPRVYFHPHTSRPKMTLSKLLAHADELFATYPPNHPSIGLDAIMGPQSVIFTWRETGFASSPYNDGLAELVDPDTAAESMLLHPELIVYPFIPDPDPKEREDAKDRTSALADVQEETGKEKRRLRRRRLFKQQQPLDPKTKAIVTGAVIVLGVAIAVYGIKAQRGGRSAFGFGNWRSDAQGKWIGPALVGVGMKLVGVLGMSAGEHALGGSEL